VYRFSWPRSLGLVLALGCLAGCASGPDANPNDPLEPLNRQVYGFNTAVDKAVLKPVATVYQDALPGVVRQGVGNFFANLGETWSFANNVMQFKGGDAAETVIRFGTNTVFGVFGVFDVASDLGIAQHKQDFGQTLAYWGVPPGPYLMLPLLGPSSVRDGSALVLDYKASLVGREKNIRWRNSLEVTQLINTRANLLRAGDLLGTASLDDYAFLRDAYLQRRDPELFKALDSERYDEPDQPDAAEPDQ
jgi:phospholipid-binding lipoprotein MlaA